MIIALALALTAAQPATLEADSGCLLGGLSAADRAEISRATQRNADLPPDLQERLQSLVESCRARLGWTAERAGPGIVMAISTVIRDDVGGTLAGNGIDPALLDAWFESQSDTIRTTPAISPEDAERAIVELGAAGAPPERLEADAELIGAYFAARSMIERVQRGLPVE